MEPRLQLDTRSKLLKAAVTVFGKYGFVSASVRKIADLAGVNHGSIKYHYSSKNELWRATVAYLFHNMEAAVFESQARWSDMTERERYIDNTASYIRFNAANPDFLRIVMYEVISQNERYEWLTENYLRPFTDRAINRVALAQEHGILRDDIPAVNLFHMNIAASRSLFFSSNELANHFGIDVFAEEEIQRHIDAMTNLFVLPEKAKAI